MSQEIHSYDRGIEDLPARRSTQTLSVQLFLTPTRNWVPYWTDQARTRSGGCGIMRKDRVDGTSVDEEMPIGELVHNVNQGVVGDSVETPPDFNFPRCKAGSISLPCHNSASDSHKGLRTTLPGGGVCQPMEQGRLKRHSLGCPYLANVPRPLGAPTVAPAPVGLDCSDSGVERVLQDCVIPCWSWLCKATYGLP